MTLITRDGGVKRGVQAGEGKSAVLQASPISGELKGKLGEKSRKRMQLVLFLCALG